VLAAASIGITQAERGYLVEGIANLERASNALRAADSHLELGRVLFWLARAYLEHGQDAAAGETLAELARLGGRLGCRPFSLAEARRGMAALVWGAEQLASGNRLQAWLQEVRAAGAAPHVEVVEKHAAPPLIKVYAFGSGRVFCDGRLLSTSDWGGSAIARELLFYLLECSPLRKDEIGATFWPDLIPARMTSAFHAAKYKAKRALGAEFVTYDVERYRIDPATDIWYDVAEFKRLLNAARRRPLDDPAALNERLQAVGLYTGDFLTDIYSDWAVDKRRVLQAKYFEALRQVVAILLRHEQFEQVLELCRRGLEFDFYREELHRGVMRSLANMGHYTEALAHYDAMSRRLMQDLHAPPEPETTSLAEHIRSRRSD
jgi:DNA-binding SARP family transcriptional activator